MRRHENDDACKDLGERLAGSFEARARGLLGTEFVLLARGGEPFGRMRLSGLEGAQIEAGGITVNLERTGRSTYRMLCGGSQLTADGHAGMASILLDGRRYEARTHLLRNLSVARSPDGRETAVVTGGLTNRRYKVAFDTGGAGTLPVALFLLCRTVALRRWVFLAFPRRPIST